MDGIGITDIYPVFYHTGTFQVITRPIKAALKLGEQLLNRFFFSTVQICTGRFFDKTHKLMTETLQQLQRFAR
ncbi:hypothetical protein OUZ56_019096 [Daphnia magna]|uniref:GMP synthase n=1 Tax=Daphnia magna TaxID=35525 RepID=A0ABQ9ZAM0_9CRUS|nr:hypothetical protein OUZ56_019096 [Daphnia magna]